jgi:Cof subfamily protein (haloacid dehalogenase superfamily)
MIGIDVDGTLVGSSGVVSSAVWQAAHRARAQGIRLVLCSGRPAFGIALDYAHELDPDGWHVFQNGASIVHRQTRESLSTPLPSSAVAELIVQARESRRVLELYSDVDYVTESGSSWAREHAALLGVSFEPRAFDSVRGVVVRAQWLVDATGAKAVIASAPEGLEIAQSSSPLMPDTQFVGLTRAGVSKGTAMETVAEKYAISLREAMYVGDSGNDLAALRIVGWPVAMANADEAVRAAARRIAGHVDANGLAEVLHWAAEPQAQV